MVTARRIGLIAAAAWLYCLVSGAAAATQHNPLVALGERLFHDQRLSVTGRYACATCHDPDRAFTDGRPRALGATGELLRFNTPTLWNAGALASYGWTDQGITTLEQQHARPLFARSPLEMGFSGEQLVRLNDDLELRRLSTQAFSHSGAPAQVGAQKASDPEIGELTQERVIAAIAAYVRTLARRTAFDAFLFEDQADALTPAERRGLGLFVSPTLACAGCHDGPLVGGFRFVDRPGLGRARVPSLRAVTETAPYMHDGAVDTLPDVIDAYATGRFADVAPFKLSVEEEHDLIAFLKTL